MSSEVNSSLGEVKVIPIGQNPPSGWRALTIDEGRQIKEEIHPLLEEWGIIAFKTGKMSGYKCKISQKYGSECNARFIVHDQQQQSGIKQRIDSKQVLRDFVRNHESIKTSLGLVVKIDFSTPFPAEFRKLTVKEGTEIKNDLLKIMGPWAIIAFEDGKIDGTGYGGQIHNSSGSQCGQIFVITSEEIKP